MVGSTVNILFQRSRLLIILCALCSVAVAGSSDSSDSDGNPYLSGCLREKLANWEKQRVCNSEDSPDAVALGVCREPDIPHEEVRIMGYNWETPYFESWLLQIILSEILDVPVTVETGSSDLVVSMYDPESAFDFGGSVTGQEPDAIETALKYDQDCTKSTPGEVCAHYFPELWNIEQDYIQDLVQNGAAEVPTAMGTVAYEGLFIPKFTAQRDPSLMSYFGMQGQANRHKLADMFLSPTTFADYCQQLSNSSCSAPDEATQRPPTPNSTEGQQFFVEGVYTGHFRKTEMHDCDKFPDNCTGHFANYPCGWSTYAEAQMYHLDIALRGSGPEVNGGYHQARLKEILSAANATQSNVLIQWWMPSMPNEQLRGTEAELVKVQLPFPTQECLNNRHSPKESSCSPDWRVRVGDPRAACDDAALSLQKLISSGLRNKINDPSIPEAIKSPAYDVLQRFSINEFQLGEIFQIWKADGSPRDAVCAWAVDNFDSFLKPLIPQSHPRTLQEKAVSSLTYVAMMLGLLSCVLVLVTTFFVYRQRHRRVFRYAQVEFLWILLFGGVALGVGATIAGSPPSNGSCVAEAWLFNIGYTLLLVPLIVKVAAINQLLAASKKMKRVQLKKEDLLGATGLVSATIIVFLVIWTALDAPAKAAEFEMTDAMTDAGNAIVEVNFYCASNSKAWLYISVGWTAVLLLCSSVLAFQTRKIRQEFRESSVLTALIYTHFVVVVLRLASVFQHSSLSASDVAHIHSILYSIDNLATLIIYFVPKFLADDRQDSMTFTGGVTDRISMGSIERCGSKASITSMRSSRFGNSFASGMLSFDSQSEKPSAFESQTEKPSTGLPPLTPCPVEPTSTTADSDVEEQQQPRVTASTPTVAEEHAENKPVSATNTAKAEMIKLVASISPPASADEMGRIGALLATVDDLRERNVSLQASQDRKLTSRVMALTMSAVAPEESQRLAVNLVTRIDELERERETLKYRRRQYKSQATT